MNLTPFFRATLRQEINGLLPAADYDQIVVLDALSFDTSAGRLNTLDVQFDNGFVPGIGDSFVIFDNRFAGAVGGHFGGLPEGAVFAAGASFLRISYSGGDGNDVVLTAVVPEPAALAALAAVAVAMRRRRRARPAAASPDHRPPLASAPPRS